MFNQYPYLNLNDLNLDYILKEIKEMYNEVTNFVSINAIKYADPIQWDITRQYEKNTIVINPLTGTAYISVAPVPSGVALTRTEYWTVVFDLGMFIVRAAKNFTYRHEAETTTTATFSTPAGGWIVWGDTLYVANVNITSGDSYVVDSNISHITMEEAKNAVYRLISDNYDAITDMVGSLEGLDTTDKSNLVAAINEVISNVNDSIDRINDTIGNKDDLNTEDTSNVVAAINEVNRIAERNARFYKLSDLEDLNYTNVQNIIDNYDIINIDVDINIGDNTLNVRSNKEIYSSNKSKITATDKVFNIVGTKSETAITVTFNGYNKGIAAGLEIGKRYLFVDNETAFRNSYPETMGSGTANIPNCYPYIFGTITAYDPSTGSFVIDSCTYWTAYWTATAYEVTEIANVNIHDLIIVNNTSNENTSVIGAYLANNLIIDHCTINASTGRGVWLRICENSKITSCGINNNIPASAYYMNNVLLLDGCMYCEIAFNNAIGAQPLDISFNGSDTLASAFIEVHHNHFNGSEDGMTTHAGTWNCDIHDNDIIVRNASGIFVRGGGHRIYNNNIVHTETDNNEAGVYVGGGCSCMDIYNNVIRNFKYALELAETTLNSYKTGGRSYLNFTNNICQYIAILCRLYRVSDFAFEIYANISDNIIIKTPTAISGDYNMFVSDGPSTNRTQFFMFMRNHYNWYDISSNESLVLVRSGEIRYMLISLEWLNGKVDTTYRTSSGASVNHAYLDVSGVFTAQQYSSGTPFTNIPKYQP